MLAREAISKARLETIFIEGAPYRYAESAICAVFIKMNPHMNKRRYRKEGQKMDLILGGRMSERRVTINIDRNEYLKSGVPRKMECD